MTRIRVVGTVDAAVAVDFDLTVREFQRQAEKANAPIPTQSDLLQEVIKASGKSASKTKPYEACLQKMSGFGIRILCPHTFTPWVIRKNFSGFRREYGK